MEDEKKRGEGERERGEIADMNIPFSSSGIAAQCRRIAV